MTDSPGPAAGWYKHPQMVNTQCYWDGTQWTDQVQPLPVDMADGVASGMGRVIVIMVVIAAVLVVGYLLFHATDDLDCTSRNIDHAQNGEPTEDCD